MFANDFIMYMNEYSSIDYTEEQLREILNLLQSFSSDYDINKKCTDLSIIEDFPYAYKVFCVTKKMEGMSDSSIKTYHSHLGKFFKYVNKPLEQITTNDIRLYLYKRHQMVSSSTVDDNVAILKSFFLWCFENDYIHQNPMKNINRIKQSKKIRSALTEDELEQLRCGCKTLRDKVVLETLYSTGCRVNELSNMKISDINFNDRTIKILGKGNKENIVFLNSRAYATIIRYLNTRTDKVDVLIYSNKTKQNVKNGGIEQIIDNISRRANINKKVTPHIIRHTTATIALKRGMSIEEVSKMLGHSSVETTMIYAEVNRQKLKNDHEKYVV